MTVNRLAHHQAGGKGTKRQRKVERTTGTGNTGAKADDREREKLAAARRGHRVQQRRDAETAEQSGTHEKEQTFQQGATEVGREIATAALIEDRQEQEKNDHENILKERDAERCASTGAVLLTGILK